MKFFKVLVRPVAKYNPDAESFSFYTSQKTAKAAIDQGYARIDGDLADAEGNKTWKVPVATQCSEEEFKENYEEGQLNINTEQEDVSDADIDSCAPAIREAIAKRLRRRPVATTDAEIDICFDAVMSHVTNTACADILIERISNTGHCNELFDYTKAEQLVRSAQERYKESLRRASESLAPVQQDEEFPRADIIFRAELSEYEKFVYDSLSTINDAHLDFSKAEYVAAGERIETVVNEHIKHTDGFDKEATLKNIMNVDWDSAEAAIKTHLNVRCLHALFKECLVTEDDEPPTFAEWAKENPGKNFDDYSQELDVEVEGVGGSCASSENAAAFTRDSDNSKLEQEIVTNDVRPTPSTSIKSLTSYSMHHELKIDRQHLNAIIDGGKCFEIRENDRCFNRGDTVTLREYDETSGEYPGLTLDIEITYVTAFQQMPGWVVFGFSYAS